MVGCEEEEVMQPIQINLPDGVRHELVCLCRIGGHEPVTVVESYIKDNWPQWWTRLQTIRDGGGKAAIERLIREVSDDARRSG